MSIAILESEIARFLSSSEPGVLCIRGRWGVGKTFGWRRALQTAIDTDQLALSRYAYVSMFGVNSINELRNTIVEETKVIQSPKGWKNSLTRSTQRGEQVIRRHARPLLNIGGAAAKITSGGDALYNLGFLSAERQLICFDDLERAGEKLPLRDMLGLASMLREQRECKIVLLFNDDAMSIKDKDELALQMEKVVDTTLKFDPTSAEAAAIVFDGDDQISAVLRDRVVRLKLVNIRVIKKIERWGRDVANILTGYRAEIRDAALATVVLAGWSILQAGEAPPPDYLITYNGYMPTKNVDADAEWSRRIRDYGYTHSDEMDAEIIRGMQRGFIDPDKIRSRADDQELAFSQTSKDNDFSRAWELYHQRIDIDDNVILDTMYAGALDGVQTITPGNMNAAIVFLRRFGRDSQASEVVSKYVTARSGEENFFDTALLFFDGERDPELVAAYDAARAARVDNRDPATVLAQIVERQGYNHEDVELIARMDADTLEQLFVNYHGPRLKDIIEWVVRFANQETEISKQLGENVQIALQRIADMSPMRAFRLENWGIKVNDVGDQVAGE